MTSANIVHTLEHHEARINGISLHYVRAGNGPLVIFLHGFPQGWFIWRALMQDFATEYTVVAPDLRGFGRSGLPRDDSEAGSRSMATDIRELAEHLGYRTFTVVGHDTGGVIAWTLALESPDLLEALAILTTAHPSTFDRAVRTDPGQIAASQYLLLLRRPEAVPALARDDFAPLRAVLAAHDFFDQPTILEHVEAWSSPGGVQGMLGWYRSERLGPAEGDVPANGNWLPEIEPQTVLAPTLVMYAEDDAFVLPAAFSGIEQYVPNAHVVRVGGASHWLIHEHHELVSSHLRALLSRRLPPRSRRPADA